MALIKCKKCGEEISSTSKRCVHCGYKSHKALIIVLSIVGGIFLLLIGLLVAFVVYILKDEAKYYGTWTNVVDYYDTKSNKFLCTVENTIKIDDYNKVEYSSKMVSGECNYPDFKYNGIYEYNFNELDVEFIINGDDEDIDILYKDDYICYDSCLNKSNFFYKNITKDNHIKEYINYYTEDTSTSDNNTTTNDSYSLGKIKEINYNEYLSLINKDDDMVIILGSPSCPHCRTLVENINNIISYDEDDIYYLNVNKISDTEYQSILNNLSLSDGIPIMTIYNHGLKEKIVGSNDENTLRELFIRYDIIDNYNL